MPSFPEISEFKIMRVLLFTVRGGLGRGTSRNFKVRVSKNLTQSRHTHWSGHLKVALEMGSTGSSDLESAHEILAAESEAVFFFELGMGVVDSETPPPSCS